MINVRIREMSLLSTHHYPTNNKSRVCSRYTDVEEVWASKPSSSTVYTDRIGWDLSQTTSRHV